MPAHSYLKTAEQRPRTKPASTWDKRASSAAGIQKKLSVGQANDKYEQEADRMAEKVVQTRPASDHVQQPAKTPAQLPLATQVTRVSRKQDTEVQTETEEQPELDSAPENGLQLKLAHPTIQRTGEKESLQLKLAGNSTEPNEQIESKINQSKGSGQPMSPATLNEMNSAFGADFSGVSIHTDSNASNLNQQLHARAFAVGSDVYFNSGQYKPESTDGKKLLAHELTHTMQQGAVHSIQRSPMIQKQDELAIIKSFLIQVDDQLKREIEQAYASWVQKNPGHTGLQAEAAYLQITKEKVAHYRSLMTDEYMKSIGLNPARVRQYAKIIRATLKQDAKDVAVQIRTKSPQYSKGYEAGYKEVQKTVALKITELTKKVASVTGKDEKAYYQVQLDELKSARYYLSKEDSKKYYSYYKDPVKALQEFIHLFQAYPIPFNKATFQQIQKQLQISGHTIRKYADDISLQLFEDAKNNQGYNLARIEAVFNGTGATSGQGEEYKPKAIPGNDQEIVDPELSKDKVKKEEEEETLKEFLTKFKKVTTTKDTSSDSYKKLIQKLREMSPEDRERFLEHVKNQRPKNDDTEADESMKMDAFEALRKYQELSELDKKILDTNRKLRRDSTNRGGKDIMVDMGELNPETNDKGRTAQEELKELTKADSILNRVKSQAGVEGSKLHIDLGWSPFLNEMSMFYGLLAGAGKRSSAIKDLSKQLMGNLAQLRSTINKEIFKTAAAGLAASALGPVAQGAAMAARLARVKSLIDTGQKVYNIGTKANELFNALKDPKLRETLKTIETKMEQVEAFEKKMAEYGSLSDEALEENLFNMEEQLRADLIALVAQKGDTIMQYLYIPEEKGADPEAFIEELMKIMYDLPKGLAAFEAMHKNYKALDGKAETTKDDAALLSLLAVDTGVYLYPFVGMLTQVANNALTSINSKEWLDTFGSKKKKHKTKRKYKKAPKDDDARKKDTKEKFAKLDRSKYIYNDTTLESVYLKKYEKRFEAYLNKPENALHKGYWTPGYFKYVARNYYKEIKKDIRRETVVAKNKKTKTTVKAPAPLFRLKNWKLTGSQFSFQLKVNPHVDVESLTNRTLTHKAFKDAGGIPYTFAAMGSTKNKRIRKKELKAWLTDNGYQFTYESDAKGNPIKDEAHAHIRRGVQVKELLHIDNGVIKDSVHSDENKAFRNFFGKRIKTSSDLPEGYVLKLFPTPLEPGRRVVSKKTGLPSRMKPLHWDGGVLTKEAKTKTPETVKNLGKHDVTTGDYDYMKSIRSMFDIQPGKPEVPKPEYNMQKKDTIAKWKNYLDKHKDSNGKKRPQKVDVNLGYIINARAFGDQLSSYKLPEMKKSDDNGHLVARRFGAQEFFNNLIPMDRIKNQKADWSKMEQEIAQKFIGQEPISGNYVHAKIDIIYPGGDTRRPSDFKVEWQEKVAGGGNQPAVPSRRGGTRKVKGSLSMSN